jgi:hypothetical protein
VKDTSVKTIFAELASQRAQFAADLFPHAHRLGGADGRRHDSWGAAPGLDGLEGRAQRPTARSPPAKAIIGKTTEKKVFVC